LANRRNLKKKASTSNTTAVTETSKKDAEEVRVKYEELLPSDILGTASTKTLIHPSQRENHSTSLNHY
jgi:hypothetical protein